MNATQTKYAARILQVQLYIQAHLDEPLSLERLAEVGQYSSCHFHRVFQSVTGENVDSYVRRLQLEQAAHSLRYRHRTVLEIALAAGYGSHEAFTRAFVRTFGVTPSEYQSLEHPPAPVKEQLMNAVSYSAATVRIERLPAQRMAYIRVVGPYCHATLGPAFGRIIGTLAARGAKTPASLCLAVYHDDPEVTAPEKQRSDVGLSVADTFQPCGDVQVQTIPAARCAVLRHQGHYDSLGLAYRWLYNVWLPESGESPADAPPYEIYVNNASQLPPSEWLTDICLPLADPG